MEEQFAKSANADPQENIPIRKKKRYFLLVSTLFLFLLAAAVFWQKAVDWNHRGWLGLEFMADPTWVEKEKQSYLTFGGSNDIYPGFISAVFSGGPADRAGIAPGAIVRRIQGLSLVSTDRIEQLHTIFVFIARARQCVRFKQFYSDYVSANCGHPRGCVNTIRPSADPAFTLRICISKRTKGSKKISQSLQMALWTVCFFYALLHDLP
ncbi:MAG: PDZ domain-containing protein [bacterium]